MINFVKDEELPFVIALTKADKLPHSKRTRARAQLAQAFSLSPQQMIITSSETKEGIQELKRKIEHEVYHD